MKGIDILTVIVMSHVNALQISILTIYAPICTKQAEMVRERQRQDENMWFEEPHVPSYIRYSVDSQPRN